MDTEFDNQATADLILHVTVKSADGVFGSFRVFAHSIVVRTAGFFHVCIPKNQLRFLKRLRNGDLKATEAEGVDADACVCETSSGESSDTDVTIPVSASASYCEDVVLTRKFPSSLSTSTSAPANEPVPVPKQRDEGYTSTSRPTPSSTSIRSNT